MRGQGRVYERFSKGLGGVYKGARNSLGRRDMLFSRSEIVLFNLNYV